MIPTFIRKLKLFEIAIWNMLPQELVNLDDENDFKGIPSYFSPFFLKTAKNLLIMWKTKNCITSMCQS